MSPEPGATHLLESGLGASAAEMPKLLAPLLCLTAWLARPAAAATFNVTDDNDPGSLRTAITNSNAAGGSNTVSWTVGGTITLGSSLPTVAANTTFDVSNAPSAVTLAGSPSAMPLGGAINFNNSSLTQPWTISAALGGIGSLNLTGGGTIVLTGVNSYQGTTGINGGALNINGDSALGNPYSLLVFNGGVLQMPSGLIDSRELEFTIGGGTFDTMGNNATFNGAVVGSGPLTKNGAGVLFLTAGNSYTAGTVIDAGSININNNGALGSGSLTFNGGSLQVGAPSLTIANLVTLTSAGTFDTQGDSITLEGVISGPGSFVQIGTGTVFLTAVNTYSGGTVVNGGILNVASDSSLGSGALTLNGGTLQAAANLYSARALNLGAGGGAIDTNGNYVALSGAIGGASGGALTKLGAGTLNLSGLSTYNGATSVQAGTLQLGASGALPAATALSVAAGAAFDLQGFTQTVGSYAGAGTTNMLLKKGVTNLTVTGNANLTGGVLTVGLANPLVSSGDAFRVVQAGSVTGTFSGIVSPAAVAFVPAYAANGVTLTATLVPFAATALNPNQAAVGNGLEPLRANPTGDAATVLSGLYQLGAADLRAALDQIGPASFSTLGALGLAGATVQGAAVSRRMAALADGGDHGGYSTFAVSRPSPYPGVLTAAAGDSDAPIPTEAGDAASPWGFFGSALATTGRLNEMIGTSGTEPGFAFNSGGFATGADCRLTDDLAAGASLGYVRGHASILSPGAGTTDDQSVRLGVYGVGRGENLRADLYLGGAFDFMATSRGIAFGPIARTATASPNGSELNVHPSVAYDLRTAERGTFSPFAAFNYDRMAVGAFSEGGAGILDLDVAPELSASLQSTLGLRYSGDFRTESRVWTPYASLGWRHEWIPQERTIDARLAGGGAPFSVSTGGYARDGAAVGMGIAATLGESTTAKLDAAGDFRSHFQNTGFNLSLRTRF